MLLQCLVKFPLTLIGEIWPVIKSDNHWLSVNGHLIEIFISKFKLYYKCVTFFVEKTCIIIQFVFCVQSKIKRNTNT